MSKIIQLSAFYRNDKPDGVGVTLTEELGDLDHAFWQLRDSYDAMWREELDNATTATLVADLLGQLDEIGQNKSHLELPMALLVIGNVWLLEKIGALKADEFNGIQLIVRRK